MNKEYSHCFNKEKQRLLEKYISVYGYETLLVILTSSENMSQQGTYKKYMHTSLPEKQPSYLDDKKFSELVYGMMYGEKEERVKLLLEIDKKIEHTKHTIVQSLLTKNIHIIDEAFRDYSYYTEVLKRVYGF